MTSLSIVLRRSLQTALGIRTNLINARAIFTSPTLKYETKKRRKRHPFFWLQDQHRKYYEEQLTPENEAFFHQFLKDRFPLNNASPLKNEPWKLDEQFQEGIARAGLIGKKLGKFNMWTKNGEKVVTTCVQISDNHVIRYHPPEEYAKIGRPVDRIRYRGLGCIIVGSDSRDPRLFTAEYNGLFNESGVMPKQKLTRFFISHEARIEPGTPLFASHFRPGMFVDVYGKTIEQGLQGLRRRHQMKLGRKTHGTTKAHNRIGSIGRGRQWCGPLKGKRMAGHEGGERRITPGLCIMRVDTKYNLLYIKGHLMGPPGAYLNIMDSRMPKKTVSLKSPPPFPTVSAEEHSKLDSELYHPDIHKASDPSIIFEVTEAERKAAALLARQMGKAKTAQKIR